MRQLFVLISTLLLVSCGHRYETSKEVKEEFDKRFIQKLDTLIVGHNKCTQCLDLFISQGNLTTPNDILKNLKNLSEKNIKVCGNFPIDLIDMTTINFDPNWKFKIIGKVIQADTNNPTGVVPLFYVDSWGKFYFDKHAWESPEDSISYPARKKMIHGVIKNAMFQGQRVSDLTNLLGEPNHIELNEIVYDIEDIYESGVDPVSSTFFIIKFDKDSIIIDKTLFTTRYGR